MLVFCHSKVHPNRRSLLVRERHGIKLKAPDKRSPCKGNVARVKSARCRAPRIRRSMRAAAAGHIQTWDMLDVACIDPRTADLSLGAMACETRPLFLAADTRTDAPLS